MNGGQRRTLFAGALVIACMLLFPPYKVEYQPVASEPEVGVMTIFLPIWDAPEQRTYYPGEMTHQVMQIRSATLDVATLLIELIGIAVVSGGIMLLLGRQHRETFTAPEVAFRGSLAKGRC